MAIANRQIQLNRYYRQMEIYAPVLPKSDTGVYLPIFLGKLFYLMPHTEEKLKNFEVSQRSV